MLATLILTAALVEPQALTSCVAGTRVVDRQGRAWTVTNNDATMCSLRNEAGATQTSLMWMLEAAGRAPAPKAAPKAPAGPAPKAGGAGAVPAGNYQCYGGSAGNMRLVFRGAGQYANEQGRAGAYTMSGANITFTTGPWEGFFGELLPDGKVGLSSRPNGRPYYMTCERR